MREDYYLVGLFSSGNGSQVGEGFYRLQWYVVEDLGKREMLEEKWKGLRLLEEEKVGIELDEDSSIEFIHKKQRSVLGRICSLRSISKEVLESIMAKF